MIFIEKHKIQAILIFILAGVLGLISSNLNINQPLLPLLTGLFGSSSIILSIKQKVKIPSQIIELPKEKKMLKPLLASCISAPLCSFLPGLGSSQASIIGHTLLSKNKSSKSQFLILLGSTNTLVMSFSFITLYLFSITRTGSTVAIKNLAQNLTPQILTLIIISILIVSIISFYLTKILSKEIIKIIEKINYTKLSKIILVLLILIVILISGFLGLLLFIASTLFGIYTISSKVKRSLMMGSIILPTIFFII